MAKLAKFLQTAAGNAGGGGLDVDEVFSIDLWNGTGRYSGSRAEQTITNGIDFSTNGGMVYIRARGTGTGNGNNGNLFSTPELGVGNFLYTTSSMASIYNQTSNTYLHTGPNQYNTDGFKLGDERDGWGAANDISTPDYVGYSFRKAPKFFDIVAYTGNGVSGRTVSHNLDAEVGMLVIKNLSNSQDWSVWHRGVNGGTNVNQWFGWLNLNNAFDDGASPFNDTAPTSTNFTLGTSSEVNGNGENYVAYLFAHHANDGSETGFGPNGDSPVISCGSYTGDNGSTGGVDINLGFEPQWVMVKADEAADNWYIIDNMRGWVSHTNQANDAYVYANANNAEATGGVLDITSTGFKTTLYSNANVNGRSYIYMAIRRGPLAAPTDATKIFAIDNQTASSAPFLTSNFPVDFVLRKDTAGSNSEIMSRLTQGKGLFANSTSAEQSDSVAQFDFSDGCLDNTSTDTSRYGWMWKRAPSYFDVVTYTGTGAGTVPHNLTVPPEMMWVKVRSQGGNWFVYHKDLAIGEYLELNTNSSKSTYNMWNNTAPTATNFSVGAFTGQSGHNFIACLFASVAGVSKVGSVNVNSTSDFDVDCGFSNGARFVLVKSTNINGHWAFVDTARGIASSGGSPTLYLSLTQGQASRDWIKPYSSGFTIKGSYWNGYNLIFYAIA